MSPDSNGIPLQTIKVADYYISSFVAHNASDLMDEVKTDSHDEVTHRRRLRLMQSKSLVGLAAMKVEELFHIDRLAG